MAWEYKFQECKRHKANVLNTNSVQQNYVVISVLPKKNIIQYIWCTGIQERGNTNLSVAEWSGRRTSGSIVFRTLAKDLQSLIIGSGI